MLPLQVRVGLGVIAIKGYSAFSKVPKFRVISSTLVGGMGRGVVALCRGAVGVYYSPPTPADWATRLLCLVSLFYDKSTFVGYLMPKPILSKNSSGTV